MIRRKLTDQELSELGRAWFTETREKSALDEAPSMLAAVGRGVWAGGLEKVLKKGIDAALADDDSAVRDQPFDPDN